MREIKFRAWDKRHGTMRTLSDDSMPSGHTSEWPVNEIFKQGSLVFMQYTGLNDCKRTAEYPEGQEIYEGDILIGSQSLVEDEEPPESVVEWVNTPYSAHFSFGVAPAAHLAEVIGNIYENPELLT